MSILLDEKHGVAYLRLQSLAWQWSLAGDYDMFTPRCAPALLDIIRKAADDERPLVVNCRRMRRLMSHALKTVAEELTTNPKAVVAFCEVDGSDSVDLYEDGPPAPTLARELEIQLKSASVLKHWKHRPSHIIYGARAGAFENTIASSLKDTAVGINLEDRSIDAAICSCFVRYATPRRLQSTPLKGPGVFKAARLIGRPPIFARIILRLADHIEDALSDDSFILPDSDIRLLACSRNAACIASCLRGFTEQCGIEGVDIVDRLGPVHRYIEDYSTHRRSVDANEVSYIFVSDFVVGGSELRAALARAQEHQRHLTHALCLGSLLPPEAFAHYCRLLRLTDLSALGMGLSYTIP